MTGDPANLEKVSVKLNLGFIAMDTEWVPDPRERQAAWELYVELATRVSTQPLDLDHGLVREALDSLHELFVVTRPILRAAGPGIGTHERSVGYLALGVLNRGLRPFLSRWHPKLVAWEATRQDGRSIVEHERLWTDNVALRGELEGLRNKLLQYGAALAEIAGTKRRRG